jgi:polar amino acid transport system substrate-binding protein
LPTPDRCRYLPRVLRPLDSPSRRPHSLLGLLIVAALVAVLGWPGGASEAQTPAPGTYPRVSTPVEAPPGSTLAKVRAEGVLRWGADAAGGAPFAFYDPADPDRTIGFEVEVMERIGQKMGVRLERVQADWLALYDVMKSGRCDLLMCGFEVTEDRQEQADFSVPYYRYGQQLTVRAADREKYPSLDALKGRPISVLNGSAAVDLLKEAGWDDAQIVQYDDSLAPYVDLALGRVEGSIAESIIAAYYAAGDERLFTHPELFSFGEYAAVVRKGDEALLAEINAILEEMKRSGELGEIYQRWGVWNDTQLELGIAKGNEQPLLPESRRPAEGDEAAAPTDWGRIARVIGKGILLTVLLTLIAMPLAVVAGLFLALGTMSRRAWLRWPATAYIILVRGTPLLVQIYLVYFSLPLLGEWVYGVVPGFVQSLLDVFGGPQMLTWPNFAVGAACLAGNYAAYEAEVHRAGLQAVPRGQREAAMSLGMSEWQVLRRVVFPQSFKIILPPLVNDLNSMIKDSSLVSVIGVPELLQTALGIGKSKFIVPKMLVIAALAYLVLCAVADWIGRRVEARLRTSANANGAKLTRLGGESH